MPLYTIHPTGGRDITDSDEARQRSDLVHQENGRRFRAPWYAGGNAFDGRQKLCGCSKCGNSWNGIKGRFYLTSDGQKYIISSAH